MTTNNPEENNNLKKIELRQSPEVEKSELIKEAFYYPYKNRAKISLNGKVNADIVFTPDKVDWQRNIKIVMEQAEAYNIDCKKHKSTFYRFLNDNESVFSTSTSNNNNGTSATGGIGATGGTGGIFGNNNTAEVIVKLVMQNVKLFKNEFEHPYALLTIDNHPVPLSIDGSKFQHYLSRLYYDNGNEKKVANAEAVNNAIRTLAAKAIFEGETIPLHLKVAWSNATAGIRDTIYYDLSDKNRRCIKITKGKGWEIVDNQTEVLFNRFGHETPQSGPIQSYDSDIFEKFINSLNIKNEKHKLLVKVWIISLLIPEIAHPMLLPYGEKGSAKSTILKKIETMIASTSMDLLSVPFVKEEFIQQLNHHFLCFYDNVTYVPRWLPDEACRATTGAAHSKRKLYTDDDDIPYRYKKIQGYTGINVVFTQEDALDRGIKIELERIRDDVIIPDTRILDELREQIPGLLGYIFDKLAKALEIKDSLVLERLPRMADFAEWGEAISRALGHTPLEFMNAYFDNIGEQNIEIVEANPFAEAISKFLDYNMMSWISPPKIFIERLRQFAEDYAIDNTKFPKNASSLTRRLNRIKSNLRDGLGIEVKIERITAGEGNKKRMNTTLIKIRTIAPVPPVPPVDEIDEGKTEKSTGGIQDTGDNTSSSNSVTETETSSPPVPPRPPVDLLLYGCNYCDKGFTDIEGHEEHFKYNHEGLPPRPTRSEIEEMQQRGTIVDFKGNAWE